MPIKHSFLFVFFALFIFGKAFADSDLDYYFNENEKLEYVEDFEHLDYDQRIEKIKILATELPGRVEFFPFSTYRSYGIWGGILMQTAWQQRTERRQIPIWYLVNSTLTGIPYNFFVSYKKGLKCSASEPTVVQMQEQLDELKGTTYEVVGPVEVCQKWMLLFEKLSRYKNNALVPCALNNFCRQIQKDMWIAHGYSMIYALGKNREIFLNKVSEEFPVEFRYWQSWANFVLQIERSPYFPSQDSLLKYGGEIATPECVGPLDELACAEEREDPLVLIMTDIVNPFLVYDKTLKNYKKILERKE